MGEEIPAKIRANVKCEVGDLLWKMVGALGLLGVALVVRGES